MATSRTPADTGSTDVPLSWRLPSPGTVRGVTGGRQSRWTATRLFLALAIAGLSCPIIFAWFAGLLRADAILVMVYVYGTACVILCVLFLVYSRLTNLISEQTARTKTFFRHQRWELDCLFRNVESSTQLQSFISPRVPLPNTRGDWAASPDFLRVIAEHILVERPRTVVELGSGVSSLYIGYLLEANGIGQLYSVDHSEVFLETTRQNVANHKLQDHVRLVHAPLHEVAVDGEPWQWYRRDALDFTEIDLLVIDGPPAGAEGHARYPAIPLLLERLAAGATIVVDDYARRADRDVVARWLDAHSCLRLVGELDTEQGTAILKKVVSR